MSSNRMAIALILAVTMLCTATTAWAQSPARVPVHGALSDASDTPIEGTLDVRFALYSDADGLMELWSETQSVTFEGGYFSAHLGETTPVDLAVFRDYSAVHLGVAVNGDQEMGLVELATAPFAGYAAFCGDAATVDGLSTDALFTTIETRLGDKAHAKYTDAEAVAAMGNTSDTNPLNHARFTQSEVVSAMGAAAPDNSLNHVRYSDADAVNAMGAAAPDNSLNHVRYTDTDAVNAMNAEAPDNPLNHARYTDADAVDAIVADNRWLMRTGDTATDLEVGALSVSSIASTSTAPISFSELTEQGGLYRLVIRGNGCSNQTWSAEIYSGASHGFLDARLAFSHCGGGCHWAFREWKGFYNAYTALFPTYDNVNNANNAGGWSITRPVTGNNGSGDTSDRMIFTKSAGTAIYCGPVDIVLESNKPIYLVSSSG